LGKSEGDVVALGLYVAVEVAVSDGRLSGVHVPVALVAGDGSAGWPSSVAVAVASSARSIDASATGAANTRSIAADLEVFDENPVSPRETNNPTNNARRAAGRVMPAPPRPVDQSYYSAI
jgi:hypothetical protein